jgi:integral membrane protein
MLKVIIEIIIGIAWVAFGAYMAKKPKNTKVNKRSDYSSDGKKKSNQNNDFADTSSDASADDSSDQDVVIESIDEDNSNTNIVAKDASKMSLIVKTKIRLFQSLQKK